MDPTMASLVCVAVFVGGNACLVYSIRKHILLKRNATMTVQGQIVKVEKDYDRESKTKQHIYIIEYMVDGMIYSMRKAATGFRPEDHLMDPVTVHYDPENPGSAWAENP